MLKQIKVMAKRVLTKVHKVAVLEDTKAYVNLNELPKGERESLMDYCSDSSEGLNEIKDNCYFRVKKWN